LQYHSDENFITAFKAYFGSTPHVFRKKVKLLHVLPFSEIHSAPHLPVA
jgi:AraC-like DNA-binding protein